MSLTSGAEMCAPLANNDFLDGRAAHRAGLSLTVVNAEVILKTSAAVDPIEAGSVMLYTGEQDGLNGFMKPLRFMQNNCI